jgi:hypothetical protein
MIRALRTIARVPTLVLFIVTFGLACACAWLDEEVRGRD